MNDPSLLTTAMTFLVVAALAAVLAVATITYLAVEAYGTMRRSARAVARRTGGTAPAYLTLRLDGQE